MMNFYRFSLFLIENLLQKQEFILRGRKFAAAEALEYGLISRVCETDGFSAELESYVKNVSTNPMEVIKFSNLT